MNCPECGSSRLTHGDFMIYQSNGNDYTCENCGCEFGIVKSSRKERDEKWKCPECNTKLSFRESSYDSEHILHEQYVCINGHVYEALAWFPIPKYAKINFGDEEE